MVDPRPCCQPRVWLTNNALKYFLVICWMVLNGFVFWRTYNHYKYSPEFFYLHEIIGQGLCISRGTASVINLNLGMLLLPMCRCLVAFMRVPFCLISPRSFRALLDHCKGFHILCGIMVTIASAIHLIGHIFNAFNFSEHYNPRCTEVNAAKRPKQDPLLIVVYSVPGVTGVLLTLVLTMIVSSAMYSVRYASYDLFWYVHRLYPVFYILVLIHALRGILKQQKNTGTHTPGCLYFNVTTGQFDQEFLAHAESEPMPWGESEPMPWLEGEPIPWAEGEPLPDGVISQWRCDEPPHFDTIGPSTWVWVIGPLVIYICDTLYRYWRRQHHPASIVGVTPHTGDIVEIQLKKENFSCRPGQFVLVQCPNISSFEWHPYTVTKCPHANTREFSLHIKATGDWSGNLVERFVGNEDSVSDAERLLPTPPITTTSLYLDGPFGSPMEEVLKYKVSLCVAGGIGITPFAAILHSILENPRQRPKRLYLVWICRDICGYSCFTQLLCDVFKQYWEDNRPDCLDIGLYLTDVENSQARMDNFTQSHSLLASRVQFGRPKWDIVLHNIATSHRRSKVGVFCCGPKLLSQSLERWCNRSGGREGTVFHYYHESF